MEIKCTLEEKTSKTGKPYTVLLVHLTDSCTKMVFLDPAELEVLKLSKVESNNQNLDEKSDTSFWK